MTARVRQQGQGGGGGGSEGGGSIPFVCVCGGGGAAPLVLMAAVFKLKSSQRSLGLRQDLTRWGLLRGGGALCHVNAVVVRQATAVGWVSSALERALCDCSHFHTQASVLWLPLSTGLLYDWMHFLCRHIHMSPFMLSLVPISLLRRLVLTGRRRHPSAAPLTPLHLSCVHQLQRLHASTLKTVKVVRCCWCLLQVLSSKEEEAPISHPLRLSNM